MTGCGYHTRHWYAYTGMVGSSAPLCVRGCGTRNPAYRPDDDPYRAERQQLAMRRIATAVSDSLTAQAAAEATEIANFDEWIKALRRINAPYAACKHRDSIVVSDTQANADLSLRGHVNIVHPADLIVDTATLTSGAT